MSNRPSDDQVGLILELGGCLHSAGAPTRKLEKTLTQVARQMDLAVQVFSTVTCLIVSFGPRGYLRKALLRLEPGDLDLGKLIHLDAAVQGYLKRRLSGTELHGQLLEKSRSSLGASLRATVLSRAAGAATWSFLLGGSWREAVAGALAGAMVGTLTYVAQRTGWMIYELPAIAALCTGAIAVTLATFWGPLSPQVASMAALLPLIPGLSLVMGVDEIAAKDWVAGSSRLINAMMSFLQLAFGVALGSRLALLFGSPEAGAVGQGLPALLQCGLLVIALRILAFQFGVSRADMPWVFAAGFVGYASARIGTSLLGLSLGSFAGALVVGSVGNAVARWLDRPALLVTVPGMFALWPGALGLQSVHAMWSEQALSSVRGALSVAMITVASVTGLLVAARVLPPRRLF